MRRAGKIVIATTLALLGGCEEKKAGPMSAAEVADELTAVRIEPGQWEATNEILSATAPGMPADALAQMTGRKSTFTNCVTPEQAAKPEANFLAAQQGSNCSYRDFAMNGGKMSGTMTCSGGATPGTMVMTMAGDYGPRSYDMTMTMETTGLPDDMGMTIEARTVGRRIGECTPAPPGKGDTK